MSRSTVSPKTAEVTPSATPVPAPITAVPKPPENPLMAVMQEEARRLALGRPIAINAGLLLTKETELLQLLAPEGVPESAPPNVQDYVLLFKEGMSELRAVNARRPFALHSSRRYSPRGRLLLKEGRETFISLRTRATERLERTSALADLRLGMGVNAKVALKNALSLFAGLQSQLAHYSDPANLALLQTAGMNPEICTAKLVPLVRDLGQVIADGTMGLNSTTELGQAVQRALAKVDVALSRGHVFLEDYVSAAAAAALSAQIPRGRRKSKASEAPAEQAPAPAPAPNVAAPAPASPAPVVAAPAPVIPAATPPASPSEPDL